MVKTVGLHSSIDALVETYGYMPDRNFRIDDPEDWALYRRFFKPLLAQIPHTEFTFWDNKVRAALYLKTRPPIHCWKCLDSGYLHNPHSTDAGLCPECKGDPKTLLSISQLLELANFPKLQSLNEASFNNFLPRPDFPSVLVAKQKAECLAQTFTQKDQSPSQGAMLHSENAGTGKTHLAIAIGRSLCYKHIQVLFIDTGEWYAKLRSHYSDKTQGEADDMIAAAQSVSVLILDDLGAPRATPDIIQKLADVIHSRYNAGKSIIATTNISGKQLVQTLGARTTTRLGSICPLINIEASNHRERSIL